MKRWLFIGFLVFVLPQIGCTSYRVIRDSEEKLPLEIATRGCVYVSVPEDGRTSREIYQGSGLATAHGFQDAFSDYVKHVSIGERPESYDDALKSALYAGCRYLVYPSIEQWEDYRTEATGKRDRIQLKVIVVDAACGDLVDAATISGKSKLFTMGGEQPQDLLATPIRIYVKSLFKQE